MVVVDMILPIVLANLGVLAVAAEEYYRVQVALQETNPRMKVEAVELVAVAVMVVSPHYIMIQVILIIIQQGQGDQPIQQGATLQIMVRLEKQAVAAVAGERREEQQGTGQRQGQGAEQYI
jgi:hypothetical protein